MTVADVLSSPTMDDETLVTIVADDVTISVRHKNRHQLSKFNFGRVDYYSHYPNINSVSIATIEIEEPVKDLPFNDKPVQDEPKPKKRGRMGAKDIEQLNMNWVKGLGGDPRYDTLEKLADSVGRSVKIIEPLIKQFEREAEE